MKEFKLQIGEKDIIIQVPDDTEIEREEAYALAVVKLQDIIADGTYPIRVTTRFYPCIFCDKNFKKQMELVSHVRDKEHLEKFRGIKNLADKHMKKKEVLPIFKKPINADKLNNEKAKHPCSICNRRFISLKVKKKHEARHDIFDTQ